MSRIYESKRSDYSSLPELPVVDWGNINATRPVKKDFTYEGPKADLPEVDTVVITWTSAEWSALDHVFLHSQTPRNSWDTDWRVDWHLYSKNAPENSGSTSELWGYYTLVNLTTKSGSTKTILLFKAGAHLAHPPYIKGLTEMVENIVKDTKAKVVYSIGTAGGGALDEILGDVAVTNAGHIELRLKENIDNCNYNNQTVANDYYPPTGLIDSVQSELFYPLSNVLTVSEFDYLIDKLHKDVPDSSQYTLNDLVNEPLNPKNLKEPKALLRKGQALLTTDYYFIAKGDDSAMYSALEMDDTVVGYAAKALGADFVFVRNISDPVVAAKTAQGEPIPDKVRNEWSSLIYETCGFYTSFNGALTTWAALAE